MDIKFKYFSCKSGHAVSRFGTGAFVGAIRRTGGFEWNENEVVPIPEVEVIKYSREYNRTVKDGALITKTEDDYKSWIKSQENKKEDTAGQADDSEVEPNKKATTYKGVVKRRKAGGKK